MRHSGAAGKMVFDSGNGIPSEKHGRTSLSNTLKLMGAVVWKAGFSSHHTLGSQARERRRLASEMLTLILPAARLPEHTGPARSTALPADGGWGIESGR